MKKVMMSEVREFVKGAMKNPCGMTFFNATLAASNHYGISHVQAQSFARGNDAQSEWTPEIKEAMRQPRAKGWDYV
jgi:hypothetical protein